MMVTTAGCIPQHPAVGNRMRRVGAHSSLAVVLTDACVLARIQFFFFVVVVVFLPTPAAEHPPLQILFSAQHFCPLCCHQHSMLRSVTNNTHFLISTNVLPYVFENHTKMFSFYFWMQFSNLNIFLRIGIEINLKKCTKKFEIRIHIYEYVVIKFCN